MFSARVAGHDEFQPRAGPAADQRPRPGAGRTTGPVRARFVAWSPIGGKVTVVDLIRRCPFREPQFSGRFRSGERTFLRIRRAGSGGSPALSKRRPVALEAAWASRG